jgi:hypothetical protein
MVREKKGWSMAGAEWLRLCLVPTLFLLARPTQAGQLAVDLEAEAGVRNDGDFAERTAATGPTVPARPQSFWRGGINLNLSYLLRDWQLAMTYSPYYEAGFGGGANNAAHNNGSANGDMAGLTHRLDIGLTGELSPRSTFHLSERLLSSPILDLFAPTLGDTVVTAREGRQTSQDSDAELAWTASRRTSVFVGANQFLRSFADPQLIDSRGVGGDTGLRFAVGPETGIEVKLGADEYDFGLGRKATVALATTSYSHLFARGSAVRVELGGFSVSAEAAATQRSLRSDGLEATLDVSRQRQRFRYDASFRHGIAPGVGVGRPVVLDNLVLGVSTVGRQITVGLSGSAARSQDFENAVDVGGSGGSGSLAVNPGRRLVDFVAGTLDVSWSFSQGGRLHGGYSRIWQSSQVAAFDTIAYNRYFLGLALAVYRTGGKPSSPAEQGGSNVQPHTP